MRQVLIIVGIISLILLIVGFIGVGFFVSETKNTKTFRESQCMVNNSYIDERTCSREECHGTSDNRKCRTVYYTCYRPVWEVRFHILFPTHHKS